MEMCDLVGKTVKEARINDEKDLILLVLLDDSRLYLSAVGDCCSSSWFEHIGGLEAVIGHEITEVINREMPESKESDDYHVTKFYGWTLVTENGRCDIEMRNRSNGYYGGWVEVHEQPLTQYGDVRDDAATKPLTEDL